MKTKLFFIGMLLSGVSMVGQKQVKKYESKEIYLSRNLDKGILISNQYDIKNAYSDYLDDIKYDYFFDGTRKESKKAFNPKMLNIFFANNVGNYITSSKDLSLQNYYTVLDANENSFFFGFTKNFGGKYKTDRISDLFNIGVKTSAKDNYASLFEKGKASNGIAVNLKYTHVFRGKIKFDTINLKKINCFREKYLEVKYTKDRNESDKDSIDITLTLEQIRDEYLRAKNVNKDKNGENKDSTALTLALKSIRDEYLKIKYVNNGKGIFKDSTDIKLALKCSNAISKDEDYFNVYDSVAEDELQFITENKLYKSFSDYWITTELYIPVTNKENYISDVFTNPSYTTIQYFDWKASLTGTWMKKWSNKQTIYGSLSANVYNNNNILNEDLTAHDFQTTQSQGLNNQAVVDVKSVYVGEFKQFVTTNFRGEISVFLLKDIAGLSFAYEKNIGNYQSENWKAGIPFSFKDIEGKPTINLELQWKEINKNHFIGFSVGYVFGSFIK